MISGATADSTDPVTVCGASGMVGGSRDVVKSCVGTGSPASVEETVVDVGSASADSVELVSVWMIYGTAFVSIELVNS